MQPYEPGCDFKGQLSPRTTGATASSAVVSGGGVWSDRPAGSSSSCGGARGDGVMELNLHDVESLATYHEEVTVMFCDIANFTSMCQQLHAAEVMLFLDTLYSRLDQLVEEYHVYKVRAVAG